jgi:UDP-N-acetylglucosamine--N-acetylmuramyl-(pentapeptide) pyrophosphoryl-undecaprenol N-acetylglucosamine transferase
MTVRSDLRVVIAGGGTGGHLYPGIAVAREILARRPSATISFAGTSRGLEARVIPREGFPLDLIRSRGLKGKSLADAFRGVLILPASVADGWRIISTRRPHLVIGVGGYSSGPIVLAAALRRAAPTMLLEQNALPGLTNRLLGPLVDRVAVTFEQSTSFFGAKAFVSGNPIRREFVEEVHPVQTVQGVHRVLVVGGSQGAHAINVAMVEAAARLAAGRPPVSVVHQTGERDVEIVRDAYRTAGLTSEVESFFYDMAKRMADADVIVCRAGSTTLSEVTARGRAAILVPLPTAADDHQRKNAEALADAGAAELLLQRDLTGSVLADRILALAADDRRRNAMAEAARRLARPEAAKRIVDEALALVDAR